MSSVYNEAAWPWVMRYTALWLVFIAWSASAGWVLSAVSMLNLTGYLVALIPLIIACFFTWKASSGRSVVSSNRWSLARFKKRWPWLLVVTLCLIGGIVYPPTNYDALSYRLPRILYWWQESHWHWLQFADDRMNYSGTGFEWQMLPLIIFTHSDRLLFLLNWLPFLLFPGLCFHALKSVGVRARIAARWMWVIPMGYGFVLQSSSVGNDALGGILVTASLALCHFAVKRRIFFPLLLSAVAAASVTALKLSSLPILLPIGLIWLKSAWQLRDQFSWKHIGYGSAVMPVLILASCLPLAAMNWHHSGNWAGDPDDDYRLRIIKPLPGLVGNSFNLAVGTFQPPLLPIPPSARKDLIEPLQGEGSFEEYVRTGFRRFDASIGAEIPIEEGAGLGMAIGILILLQIIQYRFRLPSDRLFLFVIGGTVVSFLVYMTKMGSESTPRLMLPYYPVALACFLTCFSVKQRRSKFIDLGFGWLPLLCVLPGLLLNPNRPMLPLGSIANLEILPENIRQRVQSVHNGYKNRNDPLAEIRYDLPPICDVIGFAGTPTQSAYSLFKPFGQRKVVEAHSGNVNTFHWLVATPHGIEDRVGVDWDSWLAASSYEITGEYEVFFLAGDNVGRWYLLHNVQSSESRD